MENDWHKVHFNPKMRAARHRVFSTMRKLKASIRASIEAAGANQPDRLAIGVLCLGGYGDVMRCVAFCNALRRQSPERHITIITTTDGTFVKHDLIWNAQLRGVIDNSESVEQWDHAYMLAELEGSFSVLYDGNVVCKALHPNTRHDVHFLSKLETVWGAYPYWNSQLTLLPWTQWEIMSKTSGIRVTPDDMIAPLEPCPLGGYDLDKMPPSYSKNLGMETGLDDIRRPFVLLQHATGVASMTKAVPVTFEDDEGKDVSPWWGQIVVKLSEAGFTTVQIGAEQEERIPGVSVDRRGLRVPAVCHLMLEAAGGLGNEGFWQYVRRSLARAAPWACIFGSTPPHIFGFKEHVNLSAEVCPRCWWEQPRWGVECPKEHPVCINIPKPELVAEAVVEMATKYQESQCSTST